MNVVAGASHVHAHVPPETRLLRGLPSLSMTVIMPPVIELREGAPPLFPRDTERAREKKRRK